MIRKSKSWTEKSGAK